MIATDQISSYLWITEVDKLDVRKTLFGKFHTDDPTIVG